MENTLDYLDKKTLKNALKNKETLLKTPEDKAHYKTIFKAIQKTKTIVQENGIDSYACYDSKGLMIVDLCTTDLLRLLIPNAKLIHTNEGEIEC